MNEWGIPDWRDPVGYGDVRAWSDMRWRWEFRRRLDAFRAECDVILNLYKRARDALEAFRKTGKEEYRRAYNSLVDDLEEIRVKHLFSWGYASDVPPLDPRVSEYSDDLLLTWPNKGVSSMSGSPESHQIKNAVTPKEGQVAITFNLDQPLAKNLELAERVLRRHQQEILGRVIHKAHDPKDKDAKARLWLEYLRVIDGKAAIKRKEFGAPRTWDDIGAVIYNANQGAGDRARKAYAKARKLAANFP